LGGHACTPDDFLIGKPVASVSYSNGVVVGLWGDSLDDMEELKKMFKEAQHEWEGEARYMQPHIVQYRVVPL
jgi:hypothetical protein